MSTGVRGRLRVALTAMFVLFSNRLGCVGSIVVSIVLSVILVLALRACGTPSW